jgi:hypothetical protein
MEDSMLANKDSLLFKTSAKGKEGEKRGETENFTCHYSDSLAAKNRLYSHPPCNGENKSAIVAP